MEIWKLENQHRKIKGYRELDQETIDLINAIKGAAEEIGKLVDGVFRFVDGDGEEVDKRWAAIARTDLQTGFMALIRSVAKPESF